MAASTLISSSTFCYSSIRDVRVHNAVVTTVSASRRFGTAFATGSPLCIQRPSYGRNIGYGSKSVSIRSEQSTDEGSGGGGGGLDVWLGRLAMIGFAASISVEIGTGKGLLENFGVTSPLPTVALAVTALVGVLTAVFIFQSASKNE